MGELSSSSNHRDGNKVVGKKLLTGLLVFMLLLAMLAAYGVLRPMPLARDPVDLSIEPGTSVRSIAELSAASGIEVHPSLLYALFRWSGQSRLIRAGSYEIPRGTSAWGLLQKLVRGDESLRAVTLIEGWTFAQFRSALAKADGLQHETSTLTDDELMTRLGRPGVMPEGRFYPDTYTYGKDSADLRILQRALLAMDRQLAQAWQLRSNDSLLQSADAALILASIVEKETGRASDRALISAVFHNRLKLGMPLQTDPTVIYGLGSHFDGNLKRGHLRADHPWNTYTRPGLPPTPIAMPGKAALLAAVQPAQTRALYFVARGDGSSQFSETLDQHNAAVDRFQRKRNSTPP